MDFPEAWRSIQSFEGPVVEWVHTYRLASSLRAEHIEALRSPSSLARILAHESLTDGQLDCHYGTRNKLKRGHALRRCGRRIRAAGVVQLCRGLSERELCVLLAQTDNVRELKRLLLATDLDEEAYEADGTGFVKVWSSTSLGELNPAARMSAQVAERADGLRRIAEREAAEARAEARARGR